jgi:hypothetical protein
MERMVEEWVVGLKSPPHLFTISSCDTPGEGTIVHCLSQAWGRSLLERLRTRKTVRGLTRRA